MSNLKVAIRVRPMSDRELEKRSVPSVIVEDRVISVTNIKVPEHHAGDSRERVRKFAFDYCYDESATQDQIFSMIESEISIALSNRYHACVLAYGQSSTGKTYTMMGLQNEPGLTPRLCERVFEYFQSSVTEDEIQKLKTSVSYLEIYNERVKDLLSLTNNGDSLKVREHPKKGPYVQNLTEHIVNNPKELLSYLSIGNSNRQVAATSNNRHSSRSHSIFIITSFSVSSNCCSRLHLVDLAGSERAHAIPNQIHNTRNGGSVNCFRPRLKEGANINRSLVALGNVICALAEQSVKSGRKRFVPYRDSVLTWLLKETLSGNSKTLMIATISPSSSCYSETVNTLRFGQRAKQIVNRPVVNEDAKEKLIRELRTEIIRLKELLNLKDLQYNKQFNLNNNNCPEMTENSVNPTKENIQLTEDEENNSVSSTETQESESVVLKVQDVVEIGIEIKEETTAEENKVDALKIKEIKDTVSVGTSTEEENLVPDLNSSNFNKTDKLIPVIDITSTVKPKPVKTVPLNRTLSVDFPKSIIGKLKREYGSHETLPMTTLKTRRESTENLSKTEKPLAETPSRSGSISESSGKSTPKKTAYQTRRVHRRSEVVAAVTQRLYSQQVKKKDDKPAEEKSMFPRQNLCSTTRMKLQELTQRALRASKRKVHSETQTESISTLRLKEKSTDVQDMNLALLKVRDANVSAIAEVQSVGINCRVENYNKSIHLTRTCAAQTEEQPKNHHVSFTSYLRNPPLTIHSYSQPIYTSSVNINVSHSVHQQKEDISDDSLEDFKQNIQLSTPDLISNHNSLEQQQTNVKSAQLDKFIENYCSNEFFATPREYCIANTSIVENSISETIQKVTVPIVCYPEIRKIDDFSETCTYFNYSKPKNKLIKLKKCSSDETESDSSSNDRKKVRFQVSKRKEIMNKLQTFMDEASTLLLKLNAVTKQVEKSEENRNKRTVILQKQIETDMTECYVQTYFPYHEASSQTSPLHNSDGLSSLDFSDIDQQDNKWENQVKSSCDKLEQCVKLAEHKSRETERIRFHDELFDNLHKFPQPFSCDTDWKYNHNDYSSLETNHSASDYGSLPRKEVFMRRSPYRNYSPKAYMKQLVAMRKQIVETSRNDLLEELKLPLSIE